MVKSYEKYDNVLLYPKLKNQIFPEPRRKDFNSYTEHGIAMDDWEQSRNAYEIKRKILIREYQEEQGRMIDLFFDDLLSELDWDVLSKEKQDVLRSYVWEHGHSNGYPECYNVAYGISDLVGALIKKDK